MEITQEIDARGLACPMPLLKAKMALSKLDSGQTLKVQATDAGSVRDFKTFADLSGNTLLSSDASDGVYTYILQKA
jgi:tRNA 2-thiouridine synthesizing protein A